MSEFVCELVNSICWFFVYYSWCVFFFKQKTAYEMRISDWSSDVCSSDLSGGQVVGAVVNEAPDLWGAVLAGVPFVDVINTMIDEDLPLPPGEWPEWGHPVTDKAAFAYILSSSPYDNATAQIGRASGRERVCQYV